MWIAQQSAGAVVNSDPLLGEAVKRQCGVRRRLRGAVCSVPCRDVFAIDARHVRIIEAIARNGRDLVRSSFTVPHGAVRVGVHLDNARAGCDGT